MRRKKNNANKSVNLQVLPVVNPNAAGIDVGAKEHLVAVPCDRDPRSVRNFQAFTPDHHELAAWLKRCGIETVALESTGIYWISLYEVLEQYGFEIRVVNARHVKHVPGRTKTDVLDCQWIQKLHGSWDEALLFALKAGLEAYRFNQTKIQECDCCVQQHLAQFESRAQCTNSPRHLKTQLQRVCGVDLTKIPGIKEQSAQIIISGVGLDMTKWKTRKAVLLFSGP